MMLLMGTAERELKGAYDLPTGPELKVMSREHCNLTAERGLNTEQDAH